MGASGDKILAYAAGILRRLNFKISKRAAEPEF